MAAQSFIVTQAGDLGIAADQISPDFSERVRRYVLTIDAENAQTAAVATALHKAARGDFLTAGRFLREHLAAGAIALRFVPIGINKSAQAAKFGRAGGQKKKEEGEANLQAVLRAAKLIRAERARRMSEHAEARQIEKMTGINRNTVRGHLRKLKKAKILD